MRLRQVALASNNLNRVVEELQRVFGLTVAYRDPGIVQFGLRNVVMPAGTGFIEVVEPVTAEAAARRFLDRRGEDAGYMLIFQVADGPAETARVEAQGVRIVERMDRDDYFVAHFHPTDFGGVLTSFDQQRSEADWLVQQGDWMPAGPDWQRAQSDDVLGIAGVTLVSADADELASIWRERLGLPSIKSGADMVALAYDAYIRFAADPSLTATKIAAVDIACRDPEAVRSRAQAMDVLCEDGSVKIAGVAFSPVRSLTKPSL